MSRRWAAAGGVAVLAATWLGPLPRLAPALFSAHMAMHVAVVAVAAPLLAVGLAGGRLDPTRRWPALAAALSASVVELVVVWLWHAPALHHAARSRPEALALEQASFLVTALWLWLSAWGGDSRRREQRAAAGVVGLLVTAMHMTLLGALLALATRPLFHHGAPGTVELLAPLDDQHLGGAIMLLGGGASYLLGGLFLTARLLRTASRERTEPC